jgi:hypothetical protein
MNYFKTSKAGIAFLKGWIREKKAWADVSQVPWYSMSGYNCARFTIDGLMAAGAISGKGVSTIPNTLYDRLWKQAAENWEDGEKKKWEVKSTIKYDLPSDTQ